MNQVKENIKKYSWGGKRPGAGRPPSGIKKKKVSVSLSLEQWERALELWDGKASHLVDKLIHRYLEEKTESNN